MDKQEGSSSKLPELWAACAWHYSNKRQGGKRQMSIL